MAKAPNVTTLLASLNIIEMPGPKKAKPPVRDPKYVLIDALKKQKDYVQAKLENKETVKTGKTNPDGTPETIKIKERMIWWKEDHDNPGHYVFPVKYGVNVLRMPGQADEYETIGGKKVKKRKGVAFTDFNDIKSKIDTIIQLAELGQFDAELLRVKTSQKKDDKSSDVKEDA